MPALRLWTGKTVHHRFSPFERRFSYDIFLIDLDIDRTQEADGYSNLFAINCPALFSFRSEDHGTQTKGAPLRPWAEEMFRAAGVELAGGPIRLVTFPRHLFFKFAPLSLWYGYGRDGSLRGMIYEVNNTFGERHCYVAAVSSTRTQHEADKSFHVSPFMDVSGQYRFTARMPDDKLRVTIENWEHGTRTHMANINALHLRATSASLLRQAVAQPLSSIGVLLGIHWQALNIWLKGAKYRRKPSSPARPATIASAVSGTVSPRSGEIA
ncbi:MAG: DUF1365 domain-containing protein [Hyphomonas sp.]